jgi:CYTH domain-containing protein
MALEIERKFLVLDDSYKHEAFSKSHICQGYICSERGRTVRIRIRDEHACVTIKGPSVDGGLARSEFEYEIPLDDAKQLMALCEPGLIDKVRWLVKSGEHIFEVDEFFGDNEGLVMAEVELSSADEQPIIPHFIGKEVTGDRRYYNSQLRKNPYRLWMHKTTY